MVCVELKQTHMKSSLIKHAAVILLLSGSAATFESCKSKPKDADIQSAIAAQSSAYPGLSASVNDGVATLTGTAQDPSQKDAFEATVKGIEGVKSVVNNITVAPPPAPVDITADDPLNKGVTDATKDFPGVTATVNDGVITLTGELSRSRLPALMQSLNSLKPKKIDNKLTLK